MLIGDCDWFVSFLILDLTDDNDEDGKSEILSMAEVFEYLLECFTPFTQVIYSMIQIYTRVLITKS